MITRVQLYLFTKLPFKLREKITIISNGCWIWSGEINRNGYGRCYVKGSRPMVHRFIYSLLNGIISNGLVLDHIYCSRDCCNPTHVSPVTVKVNTHRGKAILFNKH